MLNFRMIFVSLIFSSIFLACAERSQSDQENQDDKTKELQASDLNFGSVHAGKSKLEQLILKNLSRFQEIKNVSILSKSSPSHFIIKNPENCQLIAANTSCAVEVIFAPVTDMVDIVESIDISYQIGTESKMLSVLFKTDKTTLIAELDLLLHSRVFDDSQIRQFARSGRSLAEGLSFEVDHSGRLLYKAMGSANHLVNIHFVNPNYLITDPNYPLAQLPLGGVLIKRGNNNAEKNAFNVFDGLVRIQREHGIFSIKSINTECYYAYASERLDQNPYAKLYALERSDNPRPLVFNDDQQWNDFRAELKNLFISLSDDKSYVVLIGTSTTFFSQNPQKAKNYVFFETAPQCLVTAKDPVRTKDAYSFDTPGSPLSDIDIHIFIPRLSKLCEKARVGGNDGQRDTYYQNSLGQCFIIDQAPAELRAMVDREKLKNNNPNPWQAESNFAKFLVKWDRALNKRELNFSVHIIPDQLKVTKRLAGVTNFDTSRYLRTRFVIPIR